jgi:ankyrin repeat protein
VGITQQFFAAIQACDVAEIQALLKQDATLVQARNADGVTPLLATIFAGRPQIAELLIARGAEVDIFAAAALGNVERLQALLQADEQLIHAYSPDGWTPLHLAAHFGQRAAVQILLEQGASVAARSKNSMHNMPLHAAMPGDHLEVVNLLLASGGEVDARQEGGFTALHEAAFQGSAALIQVLLAHGADPGVRTESGEAAADLAREQGHYDVIALFENR